MDNSNRGIWEDDKWGVTQLYGPYTGFDYSKATGIIYPDDPVTPNFFEAVVYKTYETNVGNYAQDPNGWPELSPVFASTETDFNRVQPYYGDKMERFAGSSSSNAAFIYYKLFSWFEDDRLDGKASSASTMKIPPGALLKWCQYNYQQTTMGIDAAYFDRDANGDPIRDSSGRIIYRGLRDRADLVDQNGVRLHPQYRNYPTGQWHCFTVDLSPVAGKDVVHWYIAYDNRRTGWVGKFRAYFDSLKVVWPNGYKP
jgi:hypothetical protein